ncbi:MAG: hypothetical protein SNJ78_02055 [Spirochaetales bacterium]
MSKTILLLLAGVVLILSGFFGCNLLSIQLAPSASDDGNGESPIQYTLIYDGNGQTEGSPPYPEKYAPGALVTVKGNIGGLRKTGFGFQGWNTKQDGTGTTFFQKETFPINEPEYYLYARWIASGTPLWARTVSTGSDYGVFFGIVTDGEGNVFAAGYQSGNQLYTYGLGVSVSGSSSLGDNAVLVKYDKTGTAEWAKSTLSPTNGTTVFYDLAADSAGNLYAVGVQVNIYEYTYSDGVFVAGKYSGENCVLVKYSPEGNALWAKSVTGGPSKTWFNAVAVSASGDVYAVGAQFGTGVYDYGNGVTAQGSSDYSNSVIVKYTSAGVPQWACSVITGTNASDFYDVAVDASNNVYVVGYQSGIGNYTYGGVSITGSSSDENAVLVKYTSSGNALWAKTTTAGTYGSVFYGIAIDNNGNIYTCGGQRGNSLYNYGSVSVAGTSSYNNAVLVKYDSGGNALWARSVSSGSDESYYYGITVDARGSVYAVGDQYGNSPLSYGPQVTVTGAYNPGYNCVIVKYDSVGKALWGKSTISAPDPSGFYKVSVDTHDQVYAVGYQYDSGTFEYGPSITATGTCQYECPLILCYVQ